MFIGSSISDHVWQHFGALFQITMSAGESVRQRFLRWRYSGQFARIGHIRIIIPLLIFWFIWTERNDAKHRDISMSSRRIMYIV